MMEQDDEESSALFSKAMKGVTPLKSTPRQQQHRKPSANTPESTLRMRRDAAQQALPPGGAALSDAWVDPIDPEQKISFSRPSIQQTRIRQLQQGLLDVQYRLDLHGYKVGEARDMVVEFLNFCRIQKICCVQIIHGKSHRNTNRQSTLKSYVNHWLKQLPEVLAFCSAPPSQGGTGSVLVLLKRK